MLRFNISALYVDAPVAVNALPNVYVYTPVLKEVPKVTPFKIVTPLVVIVAELLKVVVVDVINVVVADKVKLPLINKLPVPVIMQVAPVVVRPAQGIVPVANVIVGEPEFESTITGVEASGLPEMAAPPELNENLLLLDGDQVPVPPVQYKAPA